MDAPVIDFTTISPFRLMREYGMSHAQILEKQRTLQESGLSLWDWHSYALLYREELSNTRKKRSREKAARTPSTPVEPSHSRMEELSMKVSGSYENVSTVASYIERLSNKQRDVINLLYSEGLRACDAARVLGIKGGAVHARKNNAIVRMQHMWQRREGT